MTYMSSGMLGATQFMPQNSSHPSTSVMMQQVPPQNGGATRSSPTEMQQCMQAMSEDSIEMRDYNSGVHHMHPHQMQMQQQQQHHQQQYNMSYHNHQQQMQQMHYHQVT